LKGVYQDKRRRNVLRFHQQVIGQTISRQQTHAAQMRRTRGEIEVWPVVDQHAQPLEAGGLRAALDGWFNARIAQAQPAHHTHDERMICRERQKVVGLFHHLARLHCDGAVNALSLKQGFESGRAEVAAKDRQVIRHPDLVIGMGFIVPEMLMGV